MKKRVIALLTLVALLVSILPAVVFAEEPVHVNSIKITVNNPVAGQTIGDWTDSLSVSIYDDNNNHIASNDDFNCRIYKYTFFDYDAYTDEEISLSDIIDSDYLYGMDLVFFDSDNYYYNSDTTVTANGSTSSIFINEIDYYDNEFYVPFALNVSDGATVVSKVELSIDNPVAGQTVGEFADTLSYVLYDENGEEITEQPYTEVYLYAYTSDDINSYIEVDKTGIIGPELKYGLDVLIFPDDNIAIHTSTEFTLNNSTDDIFMSDSGLTAVDDDKFLYIPFALDVVEDTAPSDAPSTDPSEEPSTAPSETPSADPSEAPSTDPSEQPSTDPSADPSTAPSENPSTEPSENPDDTAPGTGDSSMLFIWIILAVLALATVISVKRRA